MGFGRCLVDAILAKGDIVYGTLRKQSDIETFETHYCNTNAHPLYMDVNNANQRAQGIREIIQKEGRLDILVNNAGYGFFGAVEEASETDVRAQMETNFFSALALTQLTLPIMRKQRSGHIVQISSVAGFCSNAGLGIYNASKFALEGFSEALAIETDPLGIKVTLVEPGPFRTHWAGASGKQAAISIDDYDATAHNVMNMIHNYSGNQPGDPQKGAELIVEAIYSSNPPLRLPLGQIAIDRIETKMKNFQQEIAQWKSQSLATSFQN